MSVASRTLAMSSSRMPIDRQAMWLDAARKLLGAPAEEFDAEAEGIAIGHAADISDRDLGRLQRARLQVGTHTGCVGRNPDRRVDEEVDQALQQADDLLRLLARCRPQVDAVEV